MTYRIRVERLGCTGASPAKPIVHEARTQIEAIALATYEVDANRSGPRCVATVFDAAGALVMAYAGGTKTAAGLARE